MENVAIYGSSYILMKELVGISLAKKIGTVKGFFISIQVVKEQGPIYINQTHIIVVGDWRGGGWVE